jgi:lipopolysaccharide transport system permease protein
MNANELPVDYSAKPLSRTSVRLQPSRGWASIGLRDLWGYRELLFFLTWRDIVVRYKQTLLGITWAIIQPLMTMVVFSIFFGRLAGVPSDGIPYPIFSFAALVPWTFFANGLGQSSNSLVSSANLVQKVYFPRLVIPISSVLGGLPDFALAFLVLLGMMVFYGLYPSIASLIWLPILLLIALITSLGVGLWLSALNVRYRDVRYVLPFLTQIWMYGTPIAYASSLLKEPWHSVYGLNPMAGVVEGFRWSLLSGNPHHFLPGLDALGYHWVGMSVGAPPGPMLAVSTFASLIILVSGAMYFRRMERTFADVV